VIQCRLDAAKGLVSWLEASRIVGKVCEQNPETGMRKTDPITEAMETIEGNVTRIVGDHLGIPGATLRLEADIVNDL